MQLHQSHDNSSYHQSKTRPQSASAAHHTKSQQQQQQLQHFSFNSNRCHTQSQHCVAAAYMHQQQLSHSQLSVDTAQQLQAMRVAASVGGIHPQRQRPPSMKVSQRMARSIEALTQGIPSTVAHMRLSCSSSSSNSGFGRQQQPPQVLTLGYISDGIDSLSQGRQGSVAAAVITAATVTTTDLISVAADTAR